VDRTGPYFKSFKLVYMMTQEDDPYTKLFSTLSGIGSVLNYVLVTYSLYTCKVNVNLYSVSSWIHL